MAGVAVKFPVRWVWLIFNDEMFGLDIINFIPEI